MHPLTPNLPDLRPLSDTRLRVRRDHLLSEIRLLEAELAPEPTLRWRVSTRRRVLSLAAVLAALAAAGAALAVTQFGVFNGPAAPTAESDRVEVASSNGWSLLAWRSSAGLCLAIQLPAMQGAVGCGFPVEGATPRRDPGEGSRVIAGLTFQTAALDEGFVTGVVAEEVSRVNATLRDGTTISTAMHDTPAELRMHTKIFFSRFDTSNPPISLTATGRDGRVLGRWQPPGSASRVVRVRP
jgi:hypothetical protein